MSNETFDLNDYCSTVGDENAADCAMNDVSSNAAFYFVLFRSGSAF